MSRLAATRAGAGVAGGGALVAAALALGSVARPAPLTGLALAMLGLALIVEAAVRRSWFPVIAGAVVIASGLGLARGAMASADTSAQLLVTSSPVAMQGMVRDAPAIRHGESLVVVDVDQMSAASGVHRGGGGVLVVLQGPADLLPGDRVRVEASGLRRPGTRPGPESLGALDREGVAAVAVSPRLTRVSSGGASLARALAVARARLMLAVDASLPEPVATLFGAIALGIRGTLPASLTSPLQDAGLIHLIATSGLKVAVVIGLLGRLLALSRPRPTVRIAAILLGVAGYVAMTGSSPAAVRAALMASAGLVTARSGRRPDPVPMLVCVAVALLAADPRLCSDVGFQLSFLGTLGILLLAGPIATRLPGPRLLVEPLAVTVAAQLATLPVMASTFGVVSLVAPFTNVVALPLVAPLIVAGWIGAPAALLHPALGWLPLQLGGVLVRVVLFIARVAATVPVAAVHTGPWPRAWSVASLLALAAGALAARAVASHRCTSAPGTAFATAAHRQPWPALRWRSGSAVTAALGAALATLGAGGMVLAGARPDGRMHVTVLPVGVASAVLVRTSDGGVTLVDAGGQPDRLLRALGDALPATTHTIDLVVLTGGERAAVAGLSGLAGRYMVTRALIPQAGIGSGAVAALQALRDGGTEVIVGDGRPWRWGGADWRCVSAGPPETASGAGPACALQVLGDGGSVLVVGDLPTSAQEEVAAFAGSSLHADLVVTPPGGSLAPALIDAAHPRAVAIPSDRTPRLSSTEAGGASVRSTAADGALDYVGGPEGLHVT